MEYFKLQKQILWGFSFFHDLIDTVNPALDKEEEEKKKRVEEIRNEYDPEVIEKAWKESITTPRKIKELSESDPERARNINRHFKNRIILTLSEHRLNVAESLPPLAWESVFLAIMSHFESSLFRVSYLLLDDHGDKQRIEGKTYRSDYKDIISDISDFNFDGIEWQQMDIRYKVRNLITHQAGLVDHAEAHVRSHIEKPDTPIEVNDMGQIELRKNYVENTNEIGWEFMVSLDEHLTAGT